MPFLEKIVAKFVPESQKPKRKSLWSSNLDILSLIKKKVPDLHFQKSNFTSSGIEGEFMFKQPDGKAGRYHITIRKVGMT